MQITLYGKVRCSLCDHAREVLDDVLDEHSERLEVRVTYVDIATDEALRARFRHDVPVLAIDGVPAFRHRIEPKQLEARLLGGEKTPLERGES